MEMNVEINDNIKNIINKAPYNITFKRNALKIYGALYLMSLRKNINGYFSVPSEYLKSINTRYYRIMDYFEEVGLIKPYTRLHNDPNDIFNNIEKKYYDVNKGISMKYKFNISTDGEIINIDLKTNKNLKWFELLSRSLLELGYEVKIKRDTFGRRVHHPVIFNYKDELKGYWKVDAVASQPRLLYLFLKEKNIIDVEYNKIFENNKDFYLELQYKLNIHERQDAKDLFMFWINGKGYVPNYKINLLFPVVSSFIKNYKNNDYKDLASHLQRIESKIWIDDILNNIEVDFAIPVHDCLIVKEKDIDYLYNYIRYKYVDIEIKKEIIK